MLESLKSITEIPDLRKRILFTLAMLAVYRLGAFIPTPGIDPNVFEQMFNQMGGSLFGLLAMFSGGSLRRLTVFALGIMPYITASIILQLLTVVSPHLEKLKKEGDLGRKKITDYTRWMTVGLSAFQGFGISIALEKQTALGVPLVNHPGPAFVFTTVLTLTTGALFIMWLGEQITSRGIGNGMSLLIFAGIVVGLPRAAADLYEKVFVNHTWNLLVLFLLLGFMVAIVAGIVFVERGERRIPIQYAKRVVGRRIMGGVSSPSAAESEQRRRDADHFCGFDPNVSTNTELVSSGAKRHHCHPVSGRRSGVVFQRVCLWRAALHPDVRCHDRLLCPLLPLDCV